MARKSKTVRRFIAPDRVKWLDRGWQPCYIGFCPSEKAWYAEMRKLGIKPALPYPQTHRATSNRFEDKDGCQCIIVTIAENLDREYLNRLTETRTLSTIAHESVHVWQWILEYIGERRRDNTMEIEAYAIQNIFRNILEAYLNARIRRRI